MKIVLFVAAGLCVILLLFGFFFLAAVRKKDKAGPHNNWRQNRKVSSDTSEDSGFAKGCGGVHHGGGSD